MFQRRELVPEFEHAASRFQLAAIVAEYAEILRESYWAWQGVWGQWRRRLSVCKG